MIQLRVNNPPQILCGALNIYLKKHKKNYTKWQNKKPEQGTCVDALFSQWKWDQSLVSSA